MKIPRLRDVLVECNAAAEQRAISRYPSLKATVAHFKTEWDDQCRALGVEPVHYFLADWFGGEAVDWAVEPRLDCHSSSSLQIGELTFGIREESRRLIRCNPRADRGSSTDLSPLDSATVFRDVACSWWFDNGLDLTQLKSSLENILCEYPELTGRLEYNTDGFPVAISRLDSGALLIVQSSSLSLTELKDGQLEPAFASSQPPFELPGFVEAFDNTALLHDEPLLKVSSATRSSLVTV